MGDETSTDPADIIDSISGAILGTIAALRTPTTATYVPTTAITTSSTTGSLGTILLLGGAVLVVLLLVRR